MNSSPSERGDAQMPNARPYFSIDIPEVINRNSAARDIIAGFAIATPTLSPAWRTVATALADARDLAAEVARLSADLAAARLGRANALAAMRAAIGAQRDGEADPLSYLRDELRAAQNASGSREKGNHGQLSPSTPASPPDPAQRYATHDVHQRRPRSVPRSSRHTAGTVGVAIPLRTRPCRR